MLQVAKIFRFEMAHAIYGYPGPCRNIHGHSYELHVAVSHRYGSDYPLPAPGFIWDFKQLKQIVQTNILDTFDHKLIVSEDYLKQHAHLDGLENLTIWKMEPSAENILLHIRDVLEKVLPPNIVLGRLKLYETSESYAEWGI